MSTLPVIPARFPDAIRFAILTAVQAAPGYFVATFDTDAEGQPYAVIQHIVTFNDGPGMWDALMIGNQDNDEGGPLFHLWDANTTETMGIYADANALGIALYDTLSARHADGRSGARYHATALAALLS